MQQRKTIWVSEALRIFLSNFNIAFADIERKTIGEKYIFKHKEYQLYSPYQILKF